VAIGAVLAAGYAGCRASQPNYENALPPESHKDCPNSTPQRNNVLLGIAGG
jgi:hypothetical protein